MPDSVKVEIYKGVSKKTDKPYEALKLTIGKYSTLIFCTPFELDYIKEELGE